MPASKAAPVAGSATLRRETGEAVMGGSGLRKRRETRKIEHCDKTTSKRRWLDQANAKQEPTRECGSPKETAMEAAQSRKGTRPPGVRHLEDKTAEDEAAGVIFVRDSSDEEDEEFYL
jgi:hypothetical protein